MSLAAIPSLALCGRTATTLGIAAISAGALSARQPVTTIRTAGLTRAAARMNLRTSRSARPVRVQELIRTTSLRSHAPSSFRPRFRKASAQAKASAWLTRQPKFRTAKEGIAPV